MRTEATRVGQRVFVAQLNIEHFRQKLAAEQNASNRQTLLDLLSDEEAELVAALKGGDSSLEKEAVKGV